MAALSGTLRHRCRTTLLRCDKFNSHAQLKTVFDVKELEPYMNELPEVNSIEDRVDETMTFLLKKGTYKGQLVFLIFLREMLTFVPKEEDLYQELNECYNSVEIEHFLLQAQFAREEGYSVMLDGSRHDPKDVVKLVRHLLGCHHISDRDQRKRVVRQLPAEIARNITSNEQDTDFADVLHILKTCSYYPDGVGQLAYALYQFEGESPEWQALDTFLRKLYKIHVTYVQLQQLQLIIMRITWPKPILKKAYIASMPEGSEIPIATSETAMCLQMLDDLVKIRKWRGETIPIVEFVEHLAFYAEQQQEQTVRDDLRDWVSKRANEISMSDTQLRALRAEIQHYKPPSAAYLLIIVDTEDQQMFDIHAWPLKSDNEPITQTSIKSDKQHVAQEDIPACLDEIFVKCADYLSEDLIIELLLPDELLCWAVDHWPISNGRRSEKLGIEYKMVVRSLQRARQRLGQHKWKGKWNQFQDFMKGKKQPTEKEPLWICEEEECEKGNFYPALLENSIACVALAFVPPSSYVLDALDAGIPVALWPRKQANDPGTFSDLCKSLLLADRSLFPRNLLELPRLVRLQRLNARNNEHHHGQHLTLLWDDPNRLPPDFTAGQFVYLR